MEWVNIKRLKGTLRQGELPAKEVAKYLAAQGALLSLLMMWLGNSDWIESPDPGLAESVTAIWLVVVAFIYWRIGRHLRVDHGQTSEDSQTKETTR